MGFLGLTWPWDTEEVVNNMVSEVAMIVFGGIIGILGLLILTGKVPLPGGVPVRLIGGFAALAVAGYIIMGVTL